MSHLVRWDVKKGTTFVHALHLDFDKETTERIGRAYGIVVVEGKGRQGEALAAHLEDAFTRGAAEAVRKLSGDAPQDQLFEAAISRTNHALNRLFGEYGLDIEPELVSAAIVAIKDHDLVAATWGAPSMLLYHPLPNGAARTFDLVDDSNAEPQQYRTANVRRCFGSIIAGRMGKRDRLLIASQDLRMFLGDDALAASIVDHEPSEATARLNRLLSPRNEAISIALLVLDVAEIRYIEHEPVARSSSRTSASMAQMLKTQSETVETMTPSLMNGLGKKVSGMLRREEPVQAAPKPQRAQREPELEPIRAVMPESKSAQTIYTPPDRTMVATALAMLGKGSKALVLGLYAALRATGSFLLAMLSKEKRIARIQATKKKTDDTMNGLVDRFNALTRPSKALLFVALTLMIVARGGVFAASWNRAKEDQVADYELSISAIQQKIDSAEASAIYHDEARANGLLTEAVAAISALPNVKPNEQNMRETLTRKVDEARKGLRREVAVGQPDILASISSTSGVASLTKLTATSDTLWVASVTGDIFKVAMTGGTAEKAGSVPGGTTPAVFISQGKDIYAASGTGEGTVITAAGKTSSVPVDFTTSSTAAVDAALYNSRLYVLDASHNRITRHLSETKDYGKPEFYLKDGTDLSGGVSLSIDGAVWVLKANGTIVRIVKGLQESFTTTPADPPVTSALALRTTANSDLFVLDASPARILRYDKTSGSLVAQYTNEMLNGATDFAIDDKGTTAYVSKGNQVLKFALPDVK